jgi:predicted RNase H-like HicB family nuclease
MVVMTRTGNFVAVFEQDVEDNVWLVHIKHLENCHTYGRTIRQATARIREALAAWLDRAPEDLVITPELPRDVALLASKVSRARHDAALAGSKAQEATVEAAQRLTAMGVSRRDAADLLGISHQRVQQLLAS